MCQCVAFASFLPQWQCVVTWAKHATEHLKNDLVLAAHLHASQEAFQRQPQTPGALRVVAEPRGQAFPILLVGVMPGLKYRLQRIIATHTNKNLQASEKSRG